MKTSKVLKRAKKQLSRKYREGVCNSVRAAKSNEAGEDKAFEVRQMIAKRVRPFTFASRWLAWRMVFGEKMPISEAAIPLSKVEALNHWIRNCTTAKDIQAWRHAWLDNMIAEFEAKGD
jgi:hypothetical protein